MRPSAPALAPFEIAVRGRGAALARFQAIGVHRKTHGAARLAPFEARGGENLVGPFGFGLLLHEARARYDHRTYMGGDLAALLQLGFHDLRRIAQILDPAIGA